MQLTGWRYALHLLHPTHAEPLYSIVKDSPRLWDYMITPMTSLEDMKHNVNNALHAFAQGTMLPFVVIDSSTNTIVGATRLYDLYTDRLTAEIGHTYYAPYAQGTGINTECKYLLFQHAFENLGLVRVQLKTDERNLRAQRAIEKLGVRKEGLIRNERALYNGTVRNAVIYRLTREEWPEIKNRLLSRIGSS